MLLAERVEHDVDLVEHVHHLHGGDVDADLVELDHVAEQDGHIWENLGGKETYNFAPWSNTNIFFLSRICCCEFFFFYQFIILVHFEE